MKLSDLKFWQKQYPAQAKITLNRRKIYIIPNRHGFMFASILLTMLAGAMNYNNSMGFVFTFLLGSIALVSILHTYYNLHRLQIRFNHCQAVFAGQTAYIHLRIDNPSPKKRYTLRLHHDLNEQSAYTDIEANNHAIIKLAYATEKRGKYLIPRISISTEFPLNIFYAWYPMYLQGEFWIYPEAKGTQKLQQQGGDGNQQSQQKHQGDDFIGYRDYSPAESPKHVDWKIVARNQGWYIKQFGGVSTEKKLWLRWQDLQHLSIEQKLSQLSLWIQQAEQQGLHYGLELPHIRYAPSHGISHKHRCLLALAQF